MITEPMLSLPILRNLSLRLGSYPTRGLQNLAIEVADRLLEPPASSTPDSPFQFSDLPKELQITVLRQTPLVTGTDVWVNRGRLHYPGFCKTSGNVALDCDVDGDKTYLLQCFCQRSHSAFNRNCDCNSARFPSSLFQVSRQIRDLASTVFYGGNLFHVIMTDDSKIARKDLISSLEWFPEGALKYLTSLILDFKGFQAVPTFADTHNRRTWEDIISLLSTQARLPALNLELHIKEFYFDDSFNHSLRASPDYEQRMRSTYIEMFEVAKGLRGLKNLFVHLDWNTSTCEDDGRRELEGLLERMVMGEQYDAWEYGKTTRFRSSLQCYEYASKTTGIHTHEASPWPTDSFSALNSISRFATSPTTRSQDNPSRAPEMAATRGARPATRAKTTPKKSDTASSTAAAATAKPISKAKAAMKATSAAVAKTKTTKTTKPKAEAKAKVTKPAAPKKATSTAAKSSKAKSKERTSEKAVKAAGKMAKEAEKAVEKGTKGAVKKGKEAKKAVEEEIEEKAPAKKSAAPKKEAKDKEAKSKAAKGEAKETKPKAAPVKTKAKASNDDKEKKPRTKKAAAPKAPASPDVVETVEEEFEKVEEEAEAAAVNGEDDDKPETRSESKPEPKPKGKATKRKSDAVANDAVEPKAKKAKASPEAKAKAPKKAAEKKSPAAKKEAKSPASKEQKTAKDTKANTKANAKSPAKGAEKAEKKPRASKVKEAKKEVMIDDGTTPEPVSPKAEIEDVDGPETDVKPDEMDTVAATGPSLLEQAKEAVGGVLGGLKDIVGVGNGKKTEKKRGRK
ncbi:hypothetical protein C1H76_6202 [Elsinoe australis]|uniref:Uncharacterized protein n=1 Tax=Elsinoe australis TaxID=40998 RepID=A0A4U7AYY2_9PEZI|nr:hypothetical protein C1H76_6202 [Elsinoe australis]